MYRNVFGEKVSKTRYREMLAAAKNRRELITADLGRRDLLKMGLLTAAGTLLPIRGLSARKSPGSNSVCVPSFEPASPKTRALVSLVYYYPILNHAWCNRGRVALQRHGKPRGLKP